MLQKCVYTVLSQQELSVQQVAAYLKGYSNHYSSHRYRNLYWLAFERSIDIDSPSPECYVMQDSDATKDDEVVSTSDGVDGDVLLDTLGNAIASEEPHSLLENEQEDEDVTLTMLNNGNVIQCSTQVHDYRLRAPDLAYLSVWDFVSCVDKVANQVSKKPIADDESDSELSDCQGHSCPSSSGATRHGPIVPH